MSGDFQIDTAHGYGGLEGGSPDPESAYSGGKVLGNDLTGLGATIGDYENSVSSKYSAESPLINGFFYKDIKLTFLRWLNIESFDKATISLSVDSGKTWTTIYTSTGNISENFWNNVNYNLSDFGATRKSGIRIKINMGPTDGSNRRSGWNIDNLAVTGDFIASDAGVVAIVAPLSGCGHTNSDSVTVWIKNFGGAAIDTIPISYTFYGPDSVVFDTIYQSIPVGDSIQFTFKNKINLANPDIYNLTITTLLPGDEDASNDVITKKIIVQPTIKPAFTETFESKQGLWKSYGNSNSTWAWGIPGNGIVPPSGTKSWITKLAGNYLNNDSSFVESVCYDLTKMNRYIVELSYFLKTDSSKDGAGIQFSTDNGVSGNYWIRMNLDGTGVGIRTVSVLWGQMVGQEFPTDGKRFDNYYLPHLKVFLFLNSGWHLHRIQV